MLRRFLVVEDDQLVGMMLEECLEALGLECAGICTDVEKALEKVAEAEFDAAIVDVYLSGGETSERVVEALVLARRPFLVATGGFIASPPPIWHGRPQLEKPFTFETLEEAIRKLR